VTGQTDLDAGISHGVVEGRVDAPHRHHRQAHTDPEHAPLAGCGCPDHAPRRACP